MKKLTEDEIQDKIELLEKARELIEEAVDNIKEAVSNTDEKERAKAYIIPTLEMCCYKETNWLGKQPSNIEELIEALEEYENEGE